MLKGISPLLSPDLLKTLCEMGHGEMIVLADANFPARSCCDRVIDASGVKIPDLLRAIMPLFELDQYVKNPVFMMQAVSGDKLDEVYMKECREIFGREPEMLERFPFYDLAKKAYAVVQTGETRQYGNVILMKGVIYTE